MGRKILDVLCASDDALPVDELVKVAGLKNPGVLYQVISELKAKITGSGLKIVSLYGRGYKLVRISPLQLER